MSKADVGRSQDLLDAAERHIAAIRRDLPNLIDRASIPSGRDGYPTRASGAQATSARVVRHESLTAIVSHGQAQAACTCGWVSPITSDLAEAHHWSTQHEDANGNALDYGDPTGEAVVASSERDPVAAAARRAMRALASAEASLRTALGLIERERTTRTPNTVDDDMWCFHHLRLDLGCEPAGDNGLCDFCSTVRAQTGVLPKKQLLERKARGRITTKDV